MRFEWDPTKAAENFAKHGVSFHEAAIALEDPLSAIGPDPDHSFDEERFVAFAISPVGRLLAIAYTERDDTIRIVSARRVSPSERRIYESER